MNIGIVLIDDHPLTRLGTARLIEHTAGLQVAEQCADIAAVRAWLGNGGRADIALLDRSLPDGDGLSLIAELKHAGIRTIMFTSASSDEDISEAIANGVDGYLLKTTEPEQLVHAIQSVAQGNSMLPTHIMQKLARGELKQDVFNTLSPREREIVELVAQGLPNKTISVRLNLSENTVRNHLSNIMDKLGMKNRVQVATMALKHTK
ncbi:DNA-binding response regulator [Sulfuriferula sp. AH1]|uniref:LuxR C-terminal-related transcriptional regulator n=1 Tax=Sulfuriferula sp. AH1 TaxID=1985873 RepID=UPI000B3B3CF9|nr:response regulator transcription factor [Sulfuriferula sp. AH1]ARU30416.1 DNA-binding response regulator [Sulfuriferula sp. AH1]